VGGAAAVPAVSPALVHVPQWWVGHRAATATSCPHQRSLPHGRGGRWGGERGGRGSAASPADDALSASAWPSTVGVAASTATRGDVGGTLDRGVGGARREGAVVNAMAAAGGSNACGEGVASGSGAGRKGEHRRKTGSTNKYLESLGAE